MLAGTASRGVTVSQMPDCHAIGSRAYDWRMAFTSRASAGRAGRGERAPRVRPGAGSSRAGRAADRAGHRGAPRATRRARRAARVRPGRRAGVAGSGRDRGRVEHRPALEGGAGSVGAVPGAVLPELWEGGAARCAGTPSTSGRGGAAGGWCQRRPRRPAARWRRADPAGHERGSARSHAMQHSSRQPHTRPHPRPRARADNPKAFDANGSRVCTKENSTRV